MTEQIITITDLRSLTLTCASCGVAFTFDIMRAAQIADECPICTAKWDDAGAVKTLRNSLQAMRELDGGGGLTVALRLAREV